MQSGVGRRLQPQLGRRVGRCARRSTSTAGRAEFAIPFRTLRYPSGTRPDLGHQLPAQHPAPERARLLGADSAAVQPLSAVAGRLAGGHPDAGAAQLQASRRMRSATSLESGAAAGGCGDARRRRRATSSTAHAEPDARRDGQHRLRPGRGRRSAGQPRSLHAVLSREAAVLPRERRLLQRRQSGRGRSVLQPPHRHRRRRRSRSRSSAAAACRARPARSTSACSTCRPTTIATSPAEQQLQRRRASAATCRTARRSAASSSTARAPAISGRATAITTAPSRLDGKWGIGQNTVLLELRRADRHARRRRRRPRLQPAVAHQPSALGPRARLPGSRRSASTPRSASSAAAATASPTRASMTRFRPKDFIKHPGAAPARDVPRLLGPRRLPGNRLHAHRQPLAVPQQHRDPHRHEPDARGRAHAVRDLPGRVRAARHLRSRRRRSWWP